MSSPTINRRQFLAGAGGSLLAGCSLSGRRTGVSIIVDTQDTVAAGGPAAWAVGQLEESLAAQGVTVRLRERLGEAAAGEHCILAAGATSPLAREVSQGAGVTVPDSPESLGLISGQASEREVLLACGHDSRGLVYALLELADRVRNSQDPAAALSMASPIVEQPANRVRSVARLFVSDVEDKPWFNDREMWREYLSMLAAQRFNRFHLAFGIGYDFLRQVEDAYFLFAYPFLVSVPGYNVRAAGLSDEERGSNLEMLKFISEEAAARAIDFHLGIWTHGYEWTNSPNPNYTIEGLSADTHAPYCRDALAKVLQECPAIKGVVFRIHGESGVPEASYDFWKTVFDGVPRSGRKLPIDMHAKGMDSRMIDVALGTGMPVTVSPKYWAEHLGMPYHQAAIRELEMPRETDNAFFALSNGERRFLRYGYGDLLREDRRHGVIHRIWPGTQRLLIWGDPVTAASHSRAFGFCGSDGVDIMEPLSFKGRRGSGIAGDRCAYADESLRPRWDWQKYLYSFRVWGRYSYNPDTDPEVCDRFLTAQFGPGGAAFQASLANANRLLPIITTTHGTSAGNNTYWPEVYTNQPIVDPEKDRVYGDTPRPRVFGNVSPLDPQMFARINDCADGLLQGSAQGKYSPVEVAVWLEDLADAADKNLAEAKAKANGQESAEFKRLAIDLELQVGLGRFFARKFRSGVLYRIYEQSNDRVALEQALKSYRAARDVWTQLAERANGVYMSDITIGERPFLRGHWMDRLPAMDLDLADMEAKLAAAKGGVEQPERLRQAVEAALGRPQRPNIDCRHTPAENFAPGERLTVELSVAGSADDEHGITAVVMHYRHVDQAERYETVEMRGGSGSYRAAIPERYTKTVFPLQYYFEIRRKSGLAGIHPGFNANLSNQPYFVVRPARTLMSAR